MTTAVSAPIVYDAATVSRILGLPCACSVPVPKAEDGEVVIYYPGCDLKALRNSEAGKERMWQDQNRYDDKGWKAEPGYYRLLLPVQNSNQKTWSEQVAHLRTIDEAWQPASVCVVATALLVHLTNTGTDLLKNVWCRAQSLADDYHSYLTVFQGRVGVHSCWDDRRNGSLWLSASRKS